MFFKLLVLGIVSLIFTACDQRPASADQNKGEQMQTLSGEVFYRERKMLPPGAELTVSLEDVSKMDEASTLIASTQQALDGAPPYAFSLKYDASKIQPKMSYSLRAKIMLGDRLLMTSTQALNPFIEPDKPISIQLSMVAAPTQAMAQNAAVKADTGLAVVSVNPLASLTNTYWKLISIGDQPVVMGEKQAREAYFQLNEAETSVKGFAGCNQMSGTYATKGNDLSFGPITATRKACMDGMDHEADFLQVLENTAYYSIHEHNLTLLNSDKKPIARFQAQYFN